MLLEEDMTLLAEKQNGNRLAVDGFSKAEACDNGVVRGRGRGRARIAQVPYRAIAVV